MIDQLIEEQPLKDDLEKGFTSKLDKIFDEIVESKEFIPISIRKLKDNLNLHDTNFSQRKRNLDKISDTIEE